MAKVHPQSAASKWQDILDEEEEGFTELTLQSGRIFTVDETKILTWTPDGPSAITDAAKWERHVKLNLKDHKRSFVILQQHHTWDRLLITHDAFKILTNEFSISPPFLVVVQSFGVRIDETEEACIASYQRVSSTQLESCIDIRYPARHGRKSCPQPWSIRHMAVYFNYNFQEQSSRWILIQPSGSVKNGLEKVHRFQDNLDASALMPFLLVVMSTEKKWGEYLRDLEKEFSEIEDKILYSKVGRGEAESFSVHFYDSQRLQRLLAKYEKLSTIIDNCVEVVRVLKEVFHSIYTQAEPPNSVYFMVEVNSYSHRMGAHRRTLEALMRRSSGALKILFQILEFRNDNALVKSNQIMQQNSLKLAELGDLTQQESIAMRHLSESARHDTRSIKFLTIVAVLYLPASLVASIFSSDLFTIIEVSQLRSQTKFVVTSQFWVFSVIALALTIVTIAPALFYERLCKKRAKMKARKSSTC